MKTFRVILLALPIFLIINFEPTTFEIIADFSGTFYEASTDSYIPISGPGWADWSGEAFPED